VAAASAEQVVPRPRLKDVALLAYLLACGLVAPASAAELPLGPRSLEERRATRVLAAGVAFTAITRSGPGGGPWRVRVLQVEAPARLDSVLSNGVVPGRETVTSMALRARAVAAVNGGFFGSRGVFDGDPIGALAVGGRLVSEPVARRAALVLPAVASRTPAAVAGLRFAGSVRIGRRRRLLDGVNRARGLIPSCGGRGGDLPAERPGAATVCSDPSELVMLSPDFGTRTRTPNEGGGVEAIVRRGVVARVRRAGNSPIPPDGYVLTGSGDAASFLRDAAFPGASVALGLDLRAGRRLLVPGSYGAIVGGGPRLLRAGRIRIPGPAEGFSAGFAARNPRTLAGIAGDGDVLLVTVDGRQRRSVGVTLVEAARLMRSLGARDALNLDGGGSTAMAVGSRLANTPSEGVQRPAADAIVVLAG